MDKNEMTEDSIDFNSQVNDSVDGKNSLYNKQMNSKEQFSAE